MYMRAVVHGVGVKGCVILSLGDTLLPQQRKAPGVCSGVMRLPLLRVFLRNITGKFAFISKIFQQFLSSIFAFLHASVQIKVYFNLNGK